MPRELSSHTRYVPNTTVVLDGAPTARLFTRYIAHTQAGITGVLNMRAEAFLPYNTKDPAKQAALRDLLSQLAIGCMVNSPAAGGSSRPGHRAVNANVCNQWVNTYDGDGLALGEFSRLDARRNIKKGDELLCCYKNGEERGDREWTGSAGTL